MWLGKAEGIGEPSRSVLVRGDAPAWLFASIDRVPALSA